jgi:4-hydroxy-tetrahydrodipicolinate reductase
VTKLLLVGYGRMGKLVEGLAAEYQCGVAGIVDPLVGQDTVDSDRWAGVDVAVDFSAPDAVAANIRAAARRHINVVVGTTGWGAQEPALRKAAADAGIGVVAAPNFSTGVLLFEAIAAHAAALFAAHDEFSAFIHEAHHQAKKDAPSGTARATADLIPGEVPIHSVRLPGLVAHQEVLLAGDGELLTIRHDTFSREAFAPGVLLALARLRSLPAGLTVGLDAIL